MIAFIPPPSEAVPAPQAPRRPAPSLGILAWLGLFTAACAVLALVPRDLRSARDER